MTDNESIKALECCIKDDCENCPYLANGLFECGEHFNEDVLDLINRQKEEIERLNNTIYTFEKHFEFGKAEAVKRFAERVKRYIDVGHLRPPTEICFSEIAVVEMIDNLVKEMVGED